MKTLLLLALLSSLSFAQTTNTSELHARILAVCPIVSVRIGNPTDKTTWIPLFDPSATNPQKAAAQVVIDNWTAADWDGTVPVRKAAKLKEILELHARRAGLTIERDYWQGQGATARVTALQAMLDQAQAQIDTLRPQS